MRKFVGNDPIYTICYQWTFNFSDQLDEIHEIWYSTKIDETISILYFIQD